MSSRKRRGKRRRTGGPSHAPHNPRGVAPPPQEQGEPELLRDVRGALRRSHPWELLCYVSTLLEAVDPRRRSPFDRDEPAGPPLHELVDSFVEIDRIETTALLTVIAELVPDEVLSRRIRQQLEDRSHKLPRWLRALAPIEVECARELSHVLGDGDNVLLGVRTASGHELAVLVYIDHNLGTLVKDAFVVDETVEEMVGRFEQQTAGDPDVTLRDLDLADARARVTEAIELAAITHPPFESDTWPACRPIVEWVVRQLPPGGQGYQRPEWDEDDVDALAERFLASPFGERHRTDDGRHLLDAILWFATDDGPGDPLRWSPVAVELLLVDWLPRKVVADADLLSGAPDVLRDVVRFSHADRGIREALTAETLAAVDRWEPEYQATIRSEWPQGPAALLAAMGVLDAEDPTGLATGGPAAGSYREAMLELLRQAVGGQQALDQLDTEPLPDEPFDWEALPDDVHDRVAEVLALTDRCCDELLDVEHRTACRRLLADVAHGDPAIFRRPARADTAAAAITWIVGRANSTFSDTGLTATDLMDWLGVAGSAQQRAATMLKAIGVDERSPVRGAERIGSPRYLVSRRRRTLVDRRDRYEAMDG